METNIFQLEVVHVKRHGTKHNQHHWGLEIISHFEVHGRPEAAVGVDTDWEQTKSGPLCI